MSVQIDTETAALAGERRLLAAMQEFVDPKTYDGKNPCTCLIGQVGKALDDENADEWTVARIVAEHFGLAIDTVNGIFTRAAYPLFEDDLEAAMQMAAEELGLTPTGKEEPYRE